MNNFSWKDTYVAEQIRETRLAEAEEARMLQIQEPHNSNGSRMTKVMIALGAFIERTGCRLQSKYQRILAQKEAAAMGAHMIMLSDSASQNNC